MGTSSSTAWYIISYTSHSQTALYKELSRGDLNISLARIANSSGDMTYGSVSDYSYGVRPAISLKPRIEYISGEGSMANPYIVATE